MNLVIDLYKWNKGRAYGADTYIEGLLRGACRTFDQVIVIVKSSNKNKSELDKFPLIVLVADNCFGYIKVLLSFKNTKVMFPLNTMPFPISNSILMVHDLSGRFYLKNYFKYKTLYQAMRFLMTLYSICIAKTIVVPSRAVRDEILKIALWKKVEVIYEANVYNYDISKIQKYTNLNNSIFVSSWRAIHKNPYYLIDCLKYIETHNYQLFERISIYFTGPFDDHYKLLRDYSKKLKIENKVYCTGILSNDMMAFFLRNSRCVFFNTRYEGFGLPLIEAEYFEKPALVADIPVCREIANKHFLFFDVGNIESGVSQINIVFDEEKYLSIIENIKQDKKSHFYQTWTDYANYLVDMS